MVGVVKKAVKTKKGGNGVSSGVEESGYYSQMIGVAEEAVKKVGNGVLNCVEGPSHKFISKGTAIIPKLSASPRFAGVSGSAFVAWIGSRYIGEGHDVVWGGKQIPVGGGDAVVAGGAGSDRYRLRFRWKGKKLVFKKPVGRGFGGNGGDLQGEFRR